MSAIKKPLFDGPEWSFEKLNVIISALQKITDAEFKMDRYPMQVEIITSEQMIDAHAHIGMPVHYRHWSFGKAFAHTKKRYQSGRMQLAYEMVINSNPSIVYCMEDNTMTLQAMVLAHAGFGHNMFFANNYMFRQWTRPEAIIDYLVFARGYIEQCEGRYGVSKVEAVLDACHSLRLHAVDRYKRPQKLSLKEDERRQEERRRQRERDVNILWSTISGHEGGKEKEKEERFPKHPEENLLYFLEKHAPELPEWKREIIRIVRKISQYFYPQVYTKVLNEGFACFMHYYLMTRLEEEGLITSGAMQEFLHIHTNIAFQPDFDDPRFSGINPYTLGFKMFMDIKRMCEHPTKEDKKWFPNFAGNDWREVIKSVVEDFRDESGIRQFLSPRLIRELALFSVCDDGSKDYVEIIKIHDDDGYKYVRNILANQFDIGLHVPRIEVFNVDRRGDRTLTLRHHMVNKCELDSDEAKRTLKHVKFLWGFPVVLESIDEQEKVQQTHKYPAQNTIVL